MAKYNIVPALHYNSHAYPSHLVVKSTLNNIQILEVGMASLSHRQLNLKHNKQDVSVHTAL